MYIYVKSILIRITEELIFTIYIFVIYKVLYKFVPFDKARICVTSFSVV